MFARALYSDSVEERETVRCFLVVQKIKFDPRYMANPPVDRRSSGQPAQSASEKAEREDGEVVEPWQ